MRDYDEALRRLSPDEFRKQYEGTWDPPGPLSEAELARMERRYRDHTDAYRLTQEVRRLRAALTAALAIVREIANHSPIETYWIDGDDMRRCVYCHPNYNAWRGQPDYPVTIDGEEHAPTCPWVRAQQIMARLDGTPD